MLDSEDGELNNLFDDIWFRTSETGEDFLYQVYLSIINKNNLFKDDPKDIDVKRLNIWLMDCDITELQIILQILEDKEKYEYCGIVKMILDEKSKDKTIRNKLAH